MSIVKKLVPLVAFAAAISITPTLRAASDDSLEHARKAQLFTLGLDYDDARKEIAQGDAEDPAIAIEKGRVALYEADCDGAVAFLSRPDVAKDERVQGLADIARGCARVTASIVILKDEANDVEIRFQDERDQALFPLLVDSVVQARASLTRDLGVTWPKPTRVIVVRDLLSLSAMTGLPYDSAKTTGTVAVAKWGRVTFLSPRAAHHGFAWRDTMAHELTHLAVTRATRDAAPLWLQEGVAKREETRWREPGPFDDRPTPDAVVERGIQLKLDLALDKLGPSIAMLPSADQAMVAFAEVTSFVRYYADAVPPDTDGVAALPKLLAELRDAKDVDTALKNASGADLKTWDGRWRAYLASKPKDPLPPLFGLGGDADIDVKDLRDRARLAELLLGREHASEALHEIDTLKSKTALDDASIRHLRATILESLGRAKDAEVLVADPKQVLSSYGPWWAIRGRLVRGAGDEPEADRSFWEAVAVDPLSVESACEGVGPGSEPKQAKNKPICEAARARGEPPIGRD